MYRLGRIIVVAVANGIVGAIFGALAGLAVGLIYLLISGSSDPYPVLCLFGAIIGAASIAMVAVLWDNGETIWIFYERTHFPSTRPRSEKAHGETRPTDLPAPACERVKPAVRKPAILFLCTGNSARSQMAEAFLKIRAGEFFDVLSAGFTPRPIHPLTFQVMNEIGIDLTGHRPKGLREFLGRTAVCCAITVCQGAEPGCPLRWPGALRHLDWPFEDPAGESADQLTKFRTVRDQIREKISDGFPELLAACSKK